jgi:hypothetical protein
LILSLVKWCSLHFALLWIFSACSIAWGAENLSQISSAGIVHWPGVVVYPKASSDKPSTFLSVGTKVEVLERSHSWLRIRHGEQQGWVNRLFLESLPTTELQSQEAESASNEPDHYLNFLASQIDSKFIADSDVAIGNFSELLLKGSHTAWVPQVIAPSRLKIGKDNLRLWIKSPKTGYLYIWSAPEEGQLTLVFPNQIDFDNRIRAAEVSHLPRQTWPIKSTGPAGKVRLMVMVSEVPRVLPPPQSLLDELSAEVSNEEQVGSGSILSRAVGNHPFWTTQNTAFGANSALIHFLKPSIDMEDCAPKTPRCSSVYGVRTVNLIKIE